MSDDLSIGGIIYILFWYLEVQLLIKGRMSSLNNFPLQNYLCSVKLQSKVVPLGSKTNEVLTSDRVHFHWVLKHTMCIGKDEILVVLECQER